MNTTLRYVVALAATVLFACGSAEMDDDDLDEEQVATADGDGTLGGSSTAGTLGGLFSCVSLPELTTHSGWGDFGVHLAFVRQKLNKLADRVQSADCGRINVKLQKITTNLETIMILSQKKGGPGRPAADQTALSEFFRTGLSQAIGLQNRILSDVARRCEQPVGDASSESSLEYVDRRSFDNAVGFQKRPSEAILLDVVVAPVSAEIILKTPNAKVRVMATDAMSGLRAFDNTLHPERQLAVFRVRKSGSEYGVSDLKADQSVTFEVGDL